MRIIAEFDKNGIKVTVFKINERLSVKFEHNLLEQTFKFRDGSGIEKAEDVMQLLDDEFMESVNNRFISMNESRFQALEKLWKSTDENFVEII